MKRSRILRIMGVVAGVAVALCVLVACTTTPAPGGSLPGDGVGVDGTDASIRDGDSAPADADASERPAARDSGDASDGN